MTTYNLLSATSWTLITSELENEDYSETTMLSEFDFPIKNLHIKKDKYPFKYMLVRPDWHIALVGNDVDFIQKASLYFHNKILNDRKNLAS